MNDDRAVSIKSMILVPAVITLAVTVLRLVGELQGWSSRLFNREAGGGGALVGIAWLVPIFGLVFGMALAKRGHRPASLGRAFLFVLGAIAIAVALVVAGSLTGNMNVGFAAVVVASIPAVVLPYKAWPALGRTLVAYGLAARIPVVLVMLFAILGNWGTHYDVVPPNGERLLAMSPVVRWFWIGVVPQLTLWMGFTVLVGALFGLVGAALARPAASPARAGA